MFDLDKVQTLVQNVGLFGVFVGGLILALLGLKNKKAEPVAELSPLKEKYDELTLRLLEANLRREFELLLREVRNLLYSELHKMEEKVRELEDDIANMRAQHRTPPRR